MSSALFYLPLIVAIIPNQAPIAGDVVFVPFPFVDGAIAKDELPPALSLFVEELTIIDASGIEVWAIEDDVCLIFWLQGLQVLLYLCYIRV
jgi:hypothetical protein